MQITTARYQNHSAIVASGLTPVRITLGAPRMRLPYAYGAMRELAPTRDIFHLPDDQFDRRYVEILEGVGVDRIRDRFADLAGDSPGLVLLCFEDLRVDGPNGCHRRVFARWWMARTGDLITELEETTGPPKARRSPPRKGGGPGPQLSLF